MRKIWLIITLFPIVCNAQEALSDHQLAAYYVKSESANKSIVTIANKIFQGRRVKDKDLIEFHNATSSIQYYYSLERKKLRSKCEIMGSRYNAAVALLDSLTQQYENELARNENSDITNEFVEKYFRPIACSEHLDLRDIISFSDLSRMYYTANLGYLKNYSLTEAPSLDPRPDWTIHFEENEQLRDSCIHAFKSRDFEEISKDMFARTLEMVKQINFQHRKNILIESGEWDAYKRKVAQASEYIKSLNISSKGEYVIDYSRLPREIYKITIPYILKDGKAIIHGTATERHFEKQVANPIPAKAAMTTYDYTKSAVYEMGKLVSQTSEGNITYWQINPEHYKIKNYEKRMQTIRNSPVIIAYSEKASADLDATLNRGFIAREVPDEILISRYAFGSISFDTFKAEIQRPYFPWGTD